MKQDETDNRIWDAPVRIVHWSLVVLLGFSWWTHPEHMDWHQLSGFAVIGLLVFRIIWGFVGSSTARFVSFLRGPGRLLAYLRGFPSRDHARSAGHNPAGGWSVIAILLVLTGQVVSGVFAVDVDGIESGPLSYMVDFDTGRWAAAMHELFFTILQVLIAAHILAILFYLIYKRTNLIGPMITGRGGDVYDAPRHFAGPLRILVVAIVAAGVAWAISQGLRLV